MKDKIKEMAYQINPGIVDDNGNRCGNCQEEMAPDDKYCRNCGTKRGEGRFTAQLNEIRVIYGPLRVYKCRECGFLWQSMTGSSCPKCGTEAGSILDE